MGDGFRQAVDEGVSVVGWAAQHPGEAASNVTKGAFDAVKTTLGATVAVGEYVGDHAYRGDMQSVVHDAQKTGQAIGHVASETADHLSHMNAHDLGKVVGHDVLPAAIAAVIVPEAAGEGIALAASAASKLGTLAKEEGVVSRVVSVCENAKAKIAEISEKMEGLNKKMDALRDNVSKTDRFEHLNPITHAESPVSKGFEKHVKECSKQLEPGANTWTTRESRCMRWGNWKTYLDLALLVNRHALYVPLLPMNSREQKSRRAFTSLRRCYTKVTGFCIILSMFCSTHSMKLDMLSTQP